MYYSMNYSSPIGSLMLVSDEENLIGLWIKGQKYYGASLAGKPIELDNKSNNSVLQKYSASNGKLVLQKAKKWLERYFEGEKPEISELSLAPIGSDFRQEVWKMLCEIPYGKVITYGEIAKKMAVHMGRQTMSAQAVGGAVAHNPISIIIPCHRVVGAGGRLTGYAGGIDRKMKLLEFEGADLSSYFVPTKGTAL